MNGPQRIVFFGSSTFSIPSLVLIAKQADVVVVTRPDATRDRGLTVSKTSVRACAENMGLPVATPRRIDAQFIEYIRSLKPDVAVLAAYGKILPEALLNIPKYGFINIHPSLLPRHRGPSPVAGSLLSGDETTGITIIKLDDKMDHGPILAQQHVSIAPREHRSVLEERLANLGADLLVPTLDKYLAGTITPREQKHELATYTKLLTREHAVIDWSLDAVSIDRMVCAYDPWPGTMTTWNGTIIKILDGKSEISLSNDKQPGTVLLLNNRLAIACGNGHFECTAIQPANKKPMDPLSFLRGHPAFVGSVLPS